MAKSEMTIDGGELLNTLQIKIRWPRAFGFRMWLTVQVLRLAGFISPVEMDADLLDRDADNAVSLTAEQLCTSPLIEDLVPSSDEWDSCEVIQDRYDLMKRKVRFAFNAQA